MKKILDKILVIDLEATCWDRNDKSYNRKDSEIIEIGVTVLDFNSLEIEKTESILVKPKYTKVSKYCTKLTSLTQEQVDRGVGFPIACEILKKDYKSLDRYWASYGDYDRDMFYRMESKFGVKSPFRGRHFNVKALFTLAFRLDVEVPMEEALRLSDIPLEGVHHRGSDDSRNIAKIFREIILAARF